MWWFRVELSHIQVCDFDAAEVLWLTIWTLATFLTDRFIYATDLSCLTDP